MRRFAFLALPLLLLALWPGPRDASAQQTPAGAWTTYLHVATCNDLICLRDTIWMATGEAGLLCYLRRENAWASITREPGGLAGNSILAMTFDRSGNLYASVPGKGVSRLDTDGRWSLVNAFDGMPSDSALSLRAQGDTVWIGTTRGLALWNGSTIAGSVPDLGTPSPFGNDNITGIAVTGDTLFVGTPAGPYLARISDRLATWVPVSSGLPSNAGVLSMATDGRTVVILAAGGGIETSFTWSASRGAWSSDFPPGVPQVRRVRDENGSILCTSVGGVYEHLPAGGWVKVDGSPPTDNADALRVEPGVDPNGVVFASTRGLLLEQAPTWITHAPPGPVGNSCFNIAWANGSVYALYDVDGVSRLRNGLWRNYPSGPSCTAGCDTTFFNVIQPIGMLIDPLGPKWVGCWSGSLARFDDEVSPPQFSNIFYASGDPVVVHQHSLVWSAAADSIHGTQAGRWFGLDTDSRGGDPNRSPQGIDLYDQSGTFVRSFLPGYPGLRNGQIRALAVDRFNRMWVAYAQNPSAGVSTFQVPDSLGKDIALTDVPDTRTLDCFGIQIYRDSVWVLATDGLHRFSRSDQKEVTRLDLAGPPAPRGAAHPLAVSPDGSVFVGTTGGVRWHRSGQPPADFTPANSPLADIEVRAVWVDPSGVLWVGTASGLNRFDPHYVPPAPPRLPSLSVTLYPNPAWRTGVGFEMRLKGQATQYEGEVYDLNGRLVHRFSAGGNGLVVWDGRDLDRRGVEPGVYFVHVRGGGAEATSRVVVIR